MDEYYCGCGENGLDDPTMGEEADSQLRGEVPAGVVGASGRTGRGGRGGTSKYGSRDRSGMDLGVGR